jgi:hypothetical protein
MGGRDKPGHDTEGRSRQSEILADGVRHMLGEHALYAPMTEVIRDEIVRALARDIAPK